MENELRIILSERGEELVIYNSNKYRFIRQRQDKMIKWRCSKNKCTASILSDSDKRSAIQILGKHNHSDILTSTIERQVLRENCKRKILVDSTSKPNKIIRTELMTHANTSTFEHKDIISVKKAMYCKKRKYYPKFPQSLNEALAQHKSYQDENCLKYKGEKFIHVSDNELTTNCLTTNKNMEFMTTSCTDFFGDGTFEYAPRYFLQPYTIHCFKSGFYVPVDYFFLSDKLKQTYIDMIKLFFGLPFLSPEYVEEAFLELMAICSNEKVGHTFSDYILKNYIEPDCPFDIKLWTREPSKNPRTTNAAENFHRTYNSQFHSAHPAMYVVIQALIETQSETELKIASVENRKIKNIPKYKIEKISNITNKYMEYIINKTPKNVIKYLEYVGLRYQGINIYK